MRLAVIGAGSWGTTVAALGARNAEHVALWARRPELAEALNTSGENPDYLPGRPLGAVMATARFDDALDGADVVALAVPSHGFRSVLAEAAPFVPPEALLLSLAKGLEQGSLKRMTEVAAEVLPHHDDGRIGVLTGPNIATEVAAGLPTASVVAMGDTAAAEAVQRLFMTDTFRVYTNPDVVGCEIAGVVKNVVALAAGIAQGLGVGDNARAALITRGLAELTRFGLALGGNPLSFLGLAGIGDIVVTCTSPRSRNRHVGEALGRGRPLADVLGEMTMVAEGVRSTAAVLQRAAAAGVEMPIAEQVQAVLDGAATPAAAVASLMMREAKSELDGLSFRGTPPIPRGLVG
jgi:glycerol-3-phosphate dehydrogenase (NAD(P)+)